MQKNGIVAQGKGEPMYQEQKKYKREERNTGLEPATLGLGKF